MGGCQHAPGAEMNGAATTSCARAMPKRRGHDSVGPDDSTHFAVGLGWLASSDQHLQGVPATRLPQHHCDSVAIPATPAPFTCSSRWSTPQRSGDLSLLCRDACPLVQSHQIANKTRDEQASHGLVWDVLSFPQFKAQMPGGSVVPHASSRWANVVRTKRSRSP
jgi:hypothetical protein